ncbi:MAG: sulfite exporter TauE/SafE family protein [Candidatus Dormibacteria bacterium]
MILSLALAWWPLHLLLLAVGFAVGAYGTLIGAGGGFVLVPVLLLIYPTETPTQLTAVSLAAVFANASSGSVAYLRARRVDTRSALMFAVATLPGAVLGALSVQALSRGAFNVIFGAVLTALSLLLLGNPERRLQIEAVFPSNERREIIDAEGTTYRYTYNLPLGLAVSVAVGFLSSLLGIGGGIIHVPFMAQVLGFPTHVATATSHAVLAVMAGAGTATHVFQGAFGGIVYRTLFLGAGVVVGAQVGARLSERVRATWLLRLLALALLVVGLRLLATPFIRL